MLHPEKDPRFTTFDPEQRNGGVPPAASTADFITPASKIFTRSHAAIPEIDARTWRLQVGGEVAQPVEFSLDDLTSQFPIRHVTAALLCAGLRRREFFELGPLHGELPWGAEPIANARWTGVSLAEVLASARLSANARHIEFTGLDRVERHGEIFAFGGSIPIDKAEDPDVVLAFALNGKPLPPEHGFPLRAVVPGWIGARSVKWLGRINVTVEASTNYFRTNAYRVQRTPNPADPRDVTAGIPIDAIALNSIIASPEADAELRAGIIELSGWAIGPNAEAPSGVEVSADGGGSWVSAEILPSSDRWSWRLWRAAVSLPRGEHQLVVRAWDQEGRTQPETLRETWNVKGYVNNAWHRVKVGVD